MDQYPIQNDSNDDPTKPSSIIIPNLNNSLPRNLKQCTLNHLISLIIYHESFNDQIINKFKHEIIEYFQTNQINGQQFMTIKREEFSENLIHYLDNNKNIGEAGKKIWDEFRNFAFDNSTYRGSIVNNLDDASSLVSTINILHNYFQNGIYDSGM